LTLTSIAEALRLAPSSAHALLNELVTHGIVIQDSDKRYRMGPLVYYLGSSFARNTPLYRSVWRDLVDLCNDLGVVGAVAVPWEEHHLVLQAHQGGRSEIGVAFGGRVPLDGGSWGKAYYAWSGEPVPKELVRYTSRSITDSAQYAEEIQLTRTRGYATDDEEFALRVSAVAAAVTSDRGYEGLASCLAPAGRIAEIGFDEIGQRLAAIASQASFALGDPGRVTLVGAE
jgi:DNA-binding IclR family transcriptional regulator